MNHINDRHPNYTTPDGKFHLVRCFHCDNEYGRENYALNVIYGQCAWCGWGIDLVKTDEKSSS